MWHAGPVHLVSRTDRVELDSSSLAQARRTPEGFLVVDAYLYRSGVQRYDMGGGKVQLEYRPPEEVFSQRTLDAHKMLPYVDEHPEDDVTPANAQQLLRGVVGQDVRRDGDRARATIVVYDADMIAQILAGKREVSVGYRCKLDPTPGVDPKTGEAYHVRQLDHVPNHLAGTMRGRAGNAVIRVDHADMITSAAPAAEGPEMKTLEEALKALEAEKALAAKEKARADSAETELLAANRDAREAKAKAAELEKARADSVDKTRAATKARIAIDRVAMGVLPELYAPTFGRADAAGAAPGECRADAMTDREVMVAVVERVDGLKIPAERSDDYVRGAYEPAAARALRGRDDWARLDQRTTESLAGGADEREPARRHFDERDGDRRGASGGEDRKDHEVNSDAAYDRYEQGLRKLSIYDRPETSIPQDRN